MKRIALFIFTNLAVIFTLSIISHLLGVDKFISNQGINFNTLLIFALIFGFGGAFISLFISKRIAKWSMNLQLINGNENSQTAWLYYTVEQQAQRAGIAMPEVAIYDSPELNAFATGPSRNNSLVAVSTGLLQSMNKQEVEAVLGHEVSHIANGDMVTTTLLQGVLNTFVIFGARVVGYFVDQLFRDNNEENSGPGLGYIISSILFEIFFGILASMIVAAHSRRREYAADAGGANLTSRYAMSSALSTLGKQHEVQLAGGLQALGISGKSSGIMALLATHPPIEKRIAALQN